ncbi:MAG: protein kinase [bacterium]|nr:protein kinase [bacterium]
MKCTNCGVENVEDARFCKSCGTSLGPEPSKEITRITGKIETEDWVIKDRFRVIRRLGKGGMGQVLLAEDVRLKRRVAIKSILAETLSDTTSKARFLREAQTASQLDHPNLCTIYEIYDDDKNDYIVMQYVDGVTVDQILKLKTLSIHKILDISLQVCEGMVEAHGKGIIHRDIKPGNVMVDKKGVVKILDFGLAKFGGKPLLKKNNTIESNLTEKGIVLGTVSYLSPEQASGKDLDLRTDIFSFGILMFEMLERQNPFKEEEQIETLYNVLNKRVMFERDAPDRLRNIIYKSLEKDKDNRYTDFKEIKKALLEFREQYSQRRQVPVNGTEVIDIKEHEHLVKDIQKTSDNEELGDLVDKIKRYKAFTEPILSTARQKRRWLLIPLLIILVALSAYYVIDRVFPGNIKRLRAKPEYKVFYLYLHPFSNDTKNTRDKGLAKKVDYLLNHSLNQFPEFKVITSAEAASIPELKTEKGVDLEELARRFHVKYQLTGRITLNNGFYTIEGQLTAINAGGKTQPLAITGKGLDSFLTSQVDNLSKRVYQVFFPDKKYHDFTIKKTSRVYGSDWKTFCDFYSGYLYKKKVEINKAKRYLLKTKGLPMSQYLLADIYCFEEDWNMAYRLIKEVNLHKSVLPKPLNCKVMALKARLDFDFGLEIKNLEELEENFAFSKEVMLDLANAHFHHGDARSALTYCQKALELDANYSNALNRMGYCYSYLGRHTRAINALDKYRNLDRTANSFDSLGDAYFYAGELIDAENYKLRALAEGEKEVYWAYLVLTDINILKARYKPAINALRKYNKLKFSQKDNAMVTAKKAYIYYADKQYKKALTAINKSLSIYDKREIKDNTAEAHWLRGLISWQLNEEDDCTIEMDWLEGFTEKYKLSKDNFMAPFKFFLHLEALLLEKEGKIEEADRKFKFLVGMKPRLSYWVTYYNYQFFHTRYVQFLIRNKKYNEALKEVNSCLEFNPNYIPALWEKGAILDQLGDHKRIEVYDKLVELYGKSDEENYLRKSLKERYK